MQISTGQAFTSWNERMVQKYDPDLYHHHKNPVIRWIEQKRVSTIIGYLHAGPEDRILEVGCGAGNIVDQVPTGRLHGTDLSKFILTKAQCRLSSRVSLTRAAGEMLPYRDACFDKVYCSEVLEHVIDPDRIVAEMIRVLKPCGTLILSIPNEHLIDRIKSLIAMTGFYRQIFSSDGYESPRVNEWHLHRFDKKHLQRLVGDRLVWKRIRCIPFAILPFRLVAVLHKPK